MNNNQQEKKICSFCGKSQDMVRKLVAGPGVCICDECIELCGEIVEEELGGSLKSDSEPNIYVVMNNGEIETAVLSAETALSKVFQVSGEASVKVYAGFTGEFKDELKKNTGESVEQ